MRTMIVAGALGALAFLTPTSAPALADKAPAARHAAQPVAVPHSRLLPLQGGQNFRDLGGYRTRSGRTVRWGLLYRSGSMHDLTAADFTYLSKLGIRAVCDFRSTDERKAEPVGWPAGHAPQVFADDYTLDMGGMDFRAAKDWTPDQARSVMAKFYPRTLEQFKSQYRRMFRQLLAHNVPLAFNCSAGKDRTGVAAALILTALDVPRETIIEDYLLSNRYFQPHKAIAADDAASQVWKSLPPAVLQAFMGVDRSYIEGVFRVIDTHAGGAEGYLRDEFGLSRVDLLALRRFYTER